MVQLRCGCKVTEKGNFEVGGRCKRCQECNLVSELHPFGEKRLSH
ncbi:MAG TPA: hypothetical protein VJC39_00445 [Candidatus Nanoarchaeia archaeon]|nr:hypothetical protein [Candidatus Nanoarchaeia archaeon]